MILHEIALFVFQLEIDLFKVNSMIIVKKPIIVRKSNENGEFLLQLYVHFMSRQNALNSKFVHKKQSR